MKLAAVGLLILIPLLSGPSWAAQPRALQGDGVEVLYPPALEAEARRVASLYPEARARMERALGVRAAPAATVVLVSDREAFRTMAGTDQVAALAVPARRLIAMDYRRVSTDPASLMPTLRHEVCHLILHEHIDGGLPRWLDEGVCQWASGGLDELAAVGRETVLKRAALSGGLRPMDSLGRFPPDGDPLVLAYEQSRSFVGFLASRRGRAGLLEVLALMHRGRTVDEAVQEALGSPLGELESQWAARLKRRNTWLTWLSDNLYTVLFALSGLILSAGFIRVLIRMRRYRDEEEEEEGPP